MTSLPDSLISSAECLMTVCPSSLQSCGAFKGLISPPSEPPGEIMSFGVSPVNYSDSDSDSGVLINMIKIPQCGVRS